MCVIVYSLLRSMMYDLSWSYIFYFLFACAKAVIVDISVLLFRYERNWLHVVNDVDNDVVNAAVPPLPFVCAIFEIDDISVFFLNTWHCLHFGIIIADRVFDSGN